MQFYWNTASLIQLQDAYGCFAPRHRPVILTGTTWPLSLSIYYLSFTECETWVIIVYLHTSWSILYVTLYIERAKELWCVILHPPKNALRLYGLTYHHLKVGGFSYLCLCFPLSRLSYFLPWNFAFPHLLLQPMTPSVLWKRAYRLPTVRKPRLIQGRKEGNRGPYFIRPPSKLLLSSFLIVEYNKGLDTPALLKLFLPSLRKRAFLVRTGSRRQRGKGTYVEITQSLASV